MLILFLLTLLFIAAMWFFRYMERKSVLRKWLILEVASGGLGVLSAVVCIIISCSQL